MDFNSADLGNSRLSEFTGITDLNMPFEADEGDCVLSLAQAFGDLGMELLDEAKKKVKPLLFSRVTTPNGESILACAYRVTRKGLYRLRVFGKQAAVKVIKFGRDFVKYAKRKGAPTRGTCSFCTTTLVIVMLLATHTYVIPAGQTVLASLVTHYRSAAAMLGALRNCLPHSIVGIITAAVEAIFRDVNGIPGHRYLVDPLGETAKSVCKGLNWCAASTGPQNN